jgi:hypothetical protein
MKSDGRVNSEEFDCRVYRWGINEQAKEDIARAFVIHKGYGDYLDTYLLLADEARRYFPNLRNDQILPGKVSNSDHLDGYAVISFGIPFNEPVPDAFKESGKCPDFKY